MQAKGPKVRHAQAPSIQQQFTIPEVSTPILDQDFKQRESQRKNYKKK